MDALALVAGCSSTRHASATAARPGGEIVFTVFENIPVAQCGGLFAVGHIRALAGYDRQGVTPLQPNFSPDGRALTVATLVEGQGELPGERILRYDGARSELRTLATTNMPFLPRWSPRRDELLVLHVGRSLEIHVVNAVHGRDVRLLRSRDLRLGVTWVGDGSRIGYTVERPARHFSVWTMRRDGGDRHLLLRDAGDPSWSPDGKLAAYWRGGPLIERPEEVRVARGDGTDVRRLPGGPFLHRFAHSLAFSPDGRSLLLLKAPAAGAKSAYRDADLVVQPSDGRAAGRSSPGT